MILIRPARHEDLGPLREIAVKTAIDTFGKFNAAENMDFFLRQAYDEAQLEKEWDEAGTQYFLAWDGPFLVGFSRLRQNNEVEILLGKNAIELQRLYVHTGNQGKKIGSLMMRNALDYAARGGYDWLWLGVWERNFKAQEFYSRWGFEKFSEHIFQMGDDPQTDWLLKKQIFRNLIYI